MSYQQLTDPVYLKNLLEREGVALQRSSGQHFLVCEEVLEAILLLVKGGPHRVTELGAGAGVLTGPLLANDFLVRAFERDRAVANVLQKVIPPKLREQLDLQIQDLRKGAWDWPEPYIIAGNIPYNLSGYIVRRITSLATAPEQVVLLVQKEVGDRMVFDPPHGSLLGLAVKLWGGAQQVLTVPAECFWHKPAVQSQLVTIIPREGMLSLGEREAVLAAAKIFFQQKRKQVGGILRRALTIDQATVIRELERCSIDPKTRPQELTETQWIALSHVVRELSS